MTLTQEERDAIRVLAEFGESCNGLCDACALYTYREPCMPFSAILIKRRLKL